MITRQLESTLRRSKKSILLLGPRQTGKSTLISGFSPDLAINLAHEATYLDFTRNPLELEERIASFHRSKPLSVFIDEVQRLPSLLNTIQVLLDKPENKIKFMLTGSSARKLKRGNANLLPGRIHTFSLGPLVASELSYQMDIRQALAYGSLPGIWTEGDTLSKEKTLRSYAGTYLKEEVQAESLTRNLEGFSRFLNIAAQWAGHFLDLSRMASAAQVARQSAVRYFEILEDCLIVHRSEAFSRSLSRRLVQHPKFYFFDLGVLNGLLGNFQASGDRIGLLFEHWIFTQILHSSHAFDREIRISSFRTEHGAEVDLIVETGGKLFVLELKASRNVGPSDLSGLKHLATFFGKKHRPFVLYLGEQPKKIEGIEILPWQSGLKEMGF